MSTRPIADLVVPKAGQNVWLVTLSAAAMAFLAVFALALSMSAARLADSWAQALSETATVRIAAQPDEIEAQTAQVLEVLRTTPGIAAATVMAQSDQAALLEPWLGPDLPLDMLPLPRLIEVTEFGGGPDRQGLRLRLAAEAPGAVYDDHTRWRRPLVQAASRLQSFALLSLVLIGGVMTAIVTLAASVALSANRQVIRVLRLVGARDRFIARAFVRRISRRALAGAGVGTALGMAALLALPDPASAVPVLAGIGFHGLSWLWPLSIPALTFVLAWSSSMATAFHILRGVT